jgi:hypothetical protein
VDVSVARGAARAVVFEQQRSILMLMLMLMLQQMMI